MTQYLLSVYQPDGPAPEPDVLAKIADDLDALNQEMVSAGAWVFSGGLCAPTTATVLRARGGDVLVTDGPYTEGKEYLGGFTIVEAPDLDVALGWGRKLTRATTLPIEVRPFAHHAGAGSH
ncbi:YciI family protein [Rhodococcus koreensis]|uniref:YciI family protein n=1 Tax=Rhodococcus koreensis TaxID=99653 RepID=UPI00366FD208